MAGAAPARPWVNSVDFARPALSAAAQGGTTSRNPKRRIGAVIWRERREPPGPGVTIGIMTRTLGVARPGRSTCEGRPARLRPT